MMSLVEMSGQFGGLDMGTLIGGLCRLHVGHRQCLLGLLRIF